MSARIRLAVAATAFVGWLSYLAYLALGHGQPVVLSRAQLMHATSWVVADVEVDDKGQLVPEIRIEKVYAGQPIAFETVSIPKLSEARLPPNKPIPGKGKYLIPLVQRFDRSFAVAPLREAEFPDPNSKEKVRTLIYPWTPEVEEQAKELAKPWQ